jgi:hypothetical protein
VLVLELLMRDIILIAIGVNDVVPRDISLMGMCSAPAMVTQEGAEVQRPAVCPVGRENVVQQNGDLHDTSRMIAIVLKVLPAGVVKRMLVAIGDGWCIGRGSGLRLRSATENGCWRAIRAVIIAVDKLPTLTHAPLRHTLWRLLLRGSGSNSGATRKTDSAARAVVHLATGRAAWRGTSRLTRASVIRTFPTGTFARVAKG